MLLGVVSDTHGHVDYTREAVRMLEGFAPAAVIHCGDIGSPEIVPLFAAWPTHFVLGNVDEGADEIEEAIAAAGQTNHGMFGQLSLSGCRIAFLHGHDTQRLRETIRSGAWDLVCSGHTHKRDLRREKKTVVLNPGALYRATPHSLAIVDLATLDVTSVTL
ncbi:MAG TPA: YfcE family phosphodiesterase [Pirellulales bacterium]|nr:YfcE family phosphodiesterase [Pirellulales bacterium]